MSDNRRYQLEKLGADVSERYRFNLKRIETESTQEDADEDAVAFYSDRAQRLDRILGRLRSRVPFLLDIAEELA